MPNLIGIDTGGTYTDAVLYEPSVGVLAKAKALTTRADLSIGIGEALANVLAAGGAAADSVEMVAMSTTLATNAIVEGLGGRICLVLIGFDERDLGRAGLRDALKGDPALLLAGGHDAFGAELRPLDLGPLSDWIDREGGTVSAYAVAGHFSVANPSHERAVRDLVVQRGGKPATCGHELSVKLNGPKRALTCVLNARLIGIIHHLIEATRRRLAAIGIGAPIMVVKGDGSLISAEEAQRRPVETILSGPAASIVGAAHLTGLADAVISDIGGTTTDIGVLRAGRPRIDPEGARVGGWSTMVEAVAMHTSGLGGDSEVHLDPHDLSGRLSLGPRRLVPVSLLAARDGDLVHGVLDRQAREDTASELTGRFAMATGQPGTETGLSEVEAELLAEIGERPAPLDRVIHARRRQAGLKRLVARGAAMLAGLTPSDAAHVLGLHAAWDRAAAEKAAALFARRRSARGLPLANDGSALSRMVIDRLVRASAEAVLDAGLAEDGVGGARPSDDAFLQRALDKASGLVEVALRLDSPLVGLGASAPTYYPAVAALLRTEAAIPADADVANAVGAVVGQVRVERSLTISRPADSAYRLHLPDGPRDVLDLDEAIAEAEASLRALVVAEATKQGAAHVEVAIARRANTARVADEDIFLEMAVTAVAAGRPAFAVGGS